MKKRYISYATALLFSFSIFGQNIKLPDVTTVIESESKKAHKDALPEFKNILEKTKGSGSIVPELPEVEIKNVPGAVVTESPAGEKSVFSEILVGGGYPFLFYGDFNISGVDQTNPFKFDFNFDSANGYNGKSVNENFSDRIINMTVDKKFKKKDLVFGYKAGFKSVERGLQGNVSGISSNNQDFIFGNGNVNYNFSNGIYLGGDLNIDFYNRFAAISSNFDFDSWIKKAGVFSLQPKFYFGWKGYGFNVGITALYDFGLNFYKSISRGNSHRGDFGINVQWQNEIIKAYGNCSFAFGNQFTDGWFLVPFSAGFDISIPVSFANRKLSIRGEGGLAATYNNIKDLENKYNFTALCSMPTDSADWYGKLNIDIPVKSSFTGNIGISYKETAFDKGAIEPDYCESSFKDGFYSFIEKNLKVLTTDFGITYHHKFFSIKGGWHSNWLDIPMLEQMQAITLNLSFQDEKARWGASLFGSYDVNNFGALPLLNIDCFVQLSQKVRMTASVKDLITVFNSNSRNYAGKYVDRGFQAGLFLKFVL